MQFRRKLDQKIAAQCIQPAGPVEADQSHAAPGLARLDQFGCCHWNENAFINWIDLSH
jgi:hypothetical protein